MAASRRRRGLRAARQQPAPPAAATRGQQPQQPMTFFITSAGPGNGANLGGLAGADRQCQTLAQAAGGGGKTWHAYLSAPRRTASRRSTRAIASAAGPWYNAKGARIAQNVADLHGDTLERRAAATTSRRRRRSPKRATPSTASATRRTATTCSPARSSTARRSPTARTIRAATGRAARRAPAQLGHHDRTGGGNTLVELDARQPRLQPGESGQHRRRRPVLLLRHQLIDHNMTRGTASPCASGPVGLIANDALRIEIEGGRHVDRTPSPFSAVSIGTRATANGTSCRRDSVPAVCGSSSTLTSRNVTFGLFWILGELPSSGAAAPPLQMPHHDAKKSRQDDFA